MIVRACKSCVLARSDAALFHDGRARLLRLHDSEVPRVAMTISQSDGVSLRFPMEHVRLRRLQPVAERIFRWPDRCRHHALCINSCVLQPDQVQWLDAATSCTLCGARVFLPMSCSAAWRAIEWSDFHELTAPPFHA
jgi:hypothetical protein